MLNRTDEATLGIIRAKKRTTEQLIDLVGGRSIVGHLESLRSRRLAATDRHGFWVTIEDDPEHAGLDDHGDHPGRPE